MNQLRLCLLYYFLYDLNMICCSFLHSILIFLKLIFLTCIGVIIPISYFPFFMDFIELNIFNIFMVISDSNSFWNDLPITLSDVKKFKLIFILSKYVIFICRAIICINEHYGNAFISPIKFFKNFFDIFLFFILMLCWIFNFSFIKKHGRK